MTATQTRPAEPAMPGGWSRFPVNMLLADGRMQQLFPKLLWVVVPLQYYYVTTATGAFNPESYIPTAALVVVYVTSVVLAGGVIAIVYPLSGSYFDRARGLISAMLGTWAVALALVCLSLAVTSYRSKVLPKDLVRELFCPTDGSTTIAMPLCDVKLGPFPGYTIFGSTTYALAAVLLLAALIVTINRLATARRKENPLARARKDFIPIPEPSIIVVWLAVAGLMTLFDWIIG